MLYFRAAAAVYEANLSLLGLGMVCAHIVPQLNFFAYLSFHFVTHVRRGRKSVVLHFGRCDNCLRVLYRQD